MRLPALKLPALPADRRARAFAVARLKAWWDGTEVDTEAVETRLALAEAEEICDADPAAEDPRLIALQTLWGEGALEPVTDTDATLLAGLSASDAARLVVVGGGLGPRLLALADAWPGRIEALEWRPPVAESARLRVARAGRTARIAVTPADLDLLSIADGAAGFALLDDGAWCDNLQRLIHQAARSVTPGGPIVLTAWTSVDGAPAAEAFASAFVEPHLRATAEIEKMLATAGVADVTVSDRTTETAAAAREALGGAAERLSAMAGEPGPGAAVLREAAWEVASWQARLRLMAAGALLRVTFSGSAPA